MKPRRIQLKRTKGWRMPAGAVKVDRTTRFGNPFRVGRGGIETKAEAVELFRKYLSRQGIGRPAALLNRIHRELPGKNPAGVKCSDCDPCHADVLLLIANHPEVTT